LRTAMSRSFSILLAAGTLVLSAAVSVRGAETSFPVQEKDEIRQTLKFPDAGRPGGLIVDNLFGKIEVLAADRTDVELVAYRTIKAKSQDKIALAKSEVKLDLKPRGDDIEIYVDGPFRCQTQDCRGVKQREWGYEVHYDFVLQVPRRTDLTLKTVSAGDITVHGVEGAFDMTNVNGKIVLESVAGSGEAHTANGEVRVSFARNPTGPCSFKTMNGDVALSFRPGLAADFRLKTMNGDAYSDFASTNLPPEEVRKETREDKTIYRRGGFSGARVGKGGPEIRCETMTGDIWIKKFD
jgi:hypothetical protein